MSGTLIKIDVQDKATAQHLKLMVERLTRPDLLLTRIGEVLTESTKQRFAEQTAPDGTPWAPLSPAYARRKAKLGKGSLKLVLDGYLQADIHYQLAGSNSVEVGTIRPYAAIHQFGGQIPIYGPRAGSVSLRTNRKGELLRNAKGGAVFARTKNENTAHKLATVRQYIAGGHTINMPARPFLGISESDRAQLLLAVNDYLSEFEGGARA